MTLDTLFDAAAKPQAQSTESLTIRRPDDWHIHLRDGAMLRAVLPFTTAQFARGIVMPNLVPPVTTVAMASEYRARILAARGEGCDFQPMMTCYLTDQTSADEIEKGHAEGVWLAAKLYPAGATTNSAHGVRDLKAIRSVLERMEKIGMPVLIHGEATDPAVDIFDRESVFMEQVLLPFLKDYQGLKVVIEHVTTQETVEIVKAHAPRVAGTVTPHHLMINRTTLFQGGLRPHLYCCRSPSASTIASRCAAR
jgi:dihydroorotase